MCVDRLSRRIASLGEDQRSEIGVGAVAFVLVVDACEPSRSAEEGRRRLLHERLGPLVYASHRMPRIGRSRVNLQHGFHVAHGSGVVFRRDAPHRPPMGLVLVSRTVSLQAWRMPLYARGAERACSAAGRGIRSCCRADPRHAGAMPCGTTCDAEIEESRHSLSCFGQFAPRGSRGRWRLHVRIDLRPRRRGSMPPRSDALEAGLLIPV